MTQRNIKVLIVDDEPIARDILEVYLNDTAGFELVGKCRNAVEAFKAIRLTGADLLLLDINMPEINGVEFLRSLKQPPLVIFTTAYPEYAMEGYDLEVIDYLLKPISKERFVKALGKAERRLNAEASREPAASPAGQEKILLVRSEGKWIKIEISAILFIEGLKDYIKLHTRDSRLIVRNTMKNFEEQLAVYPNFTRIHKSFIVNMDFVTEIDGNFVKLNDQLLSVGNTYKDSVNHHFIAYKIKR